MKATRGNRGVEGHSGRNRLTFPALPGACARNPSIEALLRDLGGRLPEALDVFGLDHVLQFLIEEVAPEDSRPRKVFYRMAQEPVLLSEWDRLANLDFATCSPLETASLLLGRPAEYRTGEIWVDDDAGARFYFETLDHALRWLPDLRQIRAVGFDPVSEAAISYCRVILAHPLRDGNGRFARAIFYGSLARHGIISTPCLALGALFDHFRANLAAATHSLVRTGDWTSYFGNMNFILEWGCARLERIGPRRSEKEGESCVL